MWCCWCCGKIHAAPFDDLVEGNSANTFCSLVASTRLKKEFRSKCPLVQHPMVGGDKTIGGVTRHEHLPHVRGKELYGQFAVAIHLWHHHIGE